MTPLADAQDADARARPSIDEDERFRQLAELGARHERGELSDTEFQREKRRILRKRECDQGDKPDRSPC